MFLLKPHVTGAEGQVTSPDVIVDRLVVDGAPRSLALLTHNAWHETDETAEAGYGIMALGGGALILPVLGVVGRLWSSPLAGPGGCTILTTASDR